MPAAAPIRPARPADLPALLALESQFPGDRLNARQFRHHLRSPRATLRVLAHDRGVAGYALLLARRGSQLRRLYSIAVDPRWRGQGFGARLLADAERIARRDGALALRLEVRVDNAAALALYERAGYRRIARIERYYEDGTAAWRCEKALSARAKA